MQDALNIRINRALHELLDGSRCASPWIVAPIMSLLAHETVGGHACQRHVGKSIDELKSRLLGQPHIPAASTFWSIESATASVCYLTATNIPRIIDWACGGPQRLQIGGVIPVRSSVGYSVIRGARRIALCKGARMVLERDTGHDFHILTTFPVQ